MIIDFIMASLLFNAVMFSAYCYFHSAHIIGKALYLFSFLFIILGSILMIKVIELFSIVGFLLFLIINGSILKCICDKMYENVFKGN